MLSTDQAIMRTAAAGKDMYELNCKRTCKLFWKQKFNCVALEDVGKTTTMSCTVYEQEVEANNFKYDI